MSITDKLAGTKVITAVAAVAMIFGAAFAVSAQSANAQGMSASELLDLLIATGVIPEDKADEARSVLEEEQESSGSSVCPYTWTRDLSSGATGQDVMKLQQFLNDQGFQVSASGPGSEGNETDYYGPATAGAVSAMQEAFASEILQPVGLSSGTGYFGPSTRAKANELCQQAAEEDEDEMDEDEDESEEDEDEMDEDESEEEEDDEELSGTVEASLSDFEVTNPSSVDLAQEETKKVMGFEFEVDNSDVNVQRVDLAMAATDGNQSEDPFDFIDTIALYHGDEMIDEWDASSESDWSDEGQTDDDTNVEFSGDEVDQWKYRMAGFNARVNAGETGQFTVEFTTTDNIDSDDLDGGSAEFEMMIAQDEGDDDGLRAVDGTGLQHEIGSFETEEVTFEEADDGELQISSNSDDPDERVVEVDEDNDTNDVTLGIMDLEAEEQDIRLNDVNVTLRGAGINNGDADSQNLSDVVSTLYLVQGGSVIESESISTNDASSTEVLFEDVEFDINEDEELAFELVADIGNRGDQNSRNFSEGTEVWVDINPDDFDGAEELTGEQDELDTNDDISGDYTSEIARLYEIAPQFSLESTDAEITEVDNSPTRGDFEITFSVTADDDEDLFIPNVSGVGATSSLSSLVEIVEEDGSAPAGPTSSNFSISSEQDEAERVSDGSGNVGWSLESGETDEFTIQGTLNNAGGNDAFYLMQMTGRLFSNSQFHDGFTNFDFDLEDWETDSINLQG
jgi:hypothetical protein